MGSKSFKMCCCSIISRLTAANRRVAISSAPPTITLFAAPMAKLTETSASSAAQFRKYGAHCVVMKPEEPEHTRSGSSWCGSPGAPVSPSVNPSLLHVPLPMLTPQALQILSPSESSPSLAIKSRSPFASLQHC